MTTSIQEFHGSKVPFGDPSWYQGWESPFYNDSHKRFAMGMREFVEREIMPFCHEWDEAKEIPKELFTKCAEAGFLGGVCGCLFFPLFHIIIFMSIFHNENLFPRNE